MRVTDSLVVVRSRSGLTRKLYVVRELTPTVTQNYYYIGARYWCSRQADNRGNMCHLSTSHGKGHKDQLTKPQNGVKRYA